MRPVILFTILFFLSTIYVCAQQVPVGKPGDNTIVCCEGHNPCQRYTVGKEINEHNCKVHGIGCSTVEKSAKLNTSSPIVMGIMGAVLGGLGGSLYKGINGEYQATAGAELGYGVFSALTLLATPNKRSVVGNLALGTIAGAVTGLGVNGAKKAISSSPSTEKTDNPTVDILIGAAGGLLLGAITKPYKHKETRNDISGVSNINKNNSFFSNMYVSLSSDKIGIRVRL